MVIVGMPVSVERKINLGPWSRVKRFPDHEVLLSPLAAARTTGDTGAMRPGADERTSSEPPSRGELFAGKTVGAPRMIIFSRIRTKLTLPIAAALLCTSCTTLRPVEVAREEIQRQILSGTLLRTGDRVSLVTSDGARHELRVADVDVAKSLVVGGGQTVRVGEIDRLDKREVSALKTAALAAGLYFGFLFALAGVP